MGEKGAKEINDITSTLGKEMKVEWREEEEKERVEVLWGKECVKKK